MTVTKIEEFKKDRFKIFIDDEFAFVLYKGELKSFKIKLNEEIDPLAYDEIVNEVLPKRAKLRAMGLLKSHMYTEKGLRDKLKESGHNQENIDIAIAYVKSYKYVDDEEYVRQYLINRICSKSRMELKLYLQKKGIESELFDTVYDELVEDEDDIEDKLIYKLLEKRLKNKTIDEIDRLELNKHINYMMNKGFSYSSIIKCIDKMKEK